MSPAGGHSDWYLGSKDEVMQFTMPGIFYTPPNQGYEQNLWTSSEVDDLHAWMWDVGSGQMVIEDKNSSQGYIGFTIGNMPFPVRAF